MKVKRFWDDISQKVKTWKVYKRLLTQGNSGSDYHSLPLLENSKVDYWPRVIRGEIGGGRKSEMNGECMESSPQPHNQVTSSMEKYEYCERKRKQDIYKYKYAKNMKEIINWLQKYIFINIISFSRTCCRAFDQNERKDKND